MPVAVISPPIHARQESALLRFVDRYFYFFMSVLIAAAVTYGFSRTVDQNLIHPAVRRPALLWVHGIVFTAWLAFFILQSLLVRLHSVKLHRTLGWFGAGLGAAVFIVGLMTAVVMSGFDARYLHLHPPSFIAVAFWDMLCFGVCFGLAIWWRRRPAHHRRLTLIATCAISAAGIGRFPSYIVPPDTFYAGVDALILLGVVRDLLIEKRVHVVYRVVLPLFIVGQVLAMYLFLGKPAFWAKIAWAIANWS
jgi:hypothetical protein